MKFAAIIGLFLIVAAAGGAVFIYSGLYDVAATRPHFDVC